MFRPSDIIIEAFIKHLKAAYWEAFPDGLPAHCNAIEKAARLALPYIARSNALYHDLSHTILVTQIGQNLLEGKMLRDPKVTSSDWMHFIISNLCFAVGFVRDACPGDDGKNHCVLNTSGEVGSIPNGASDGWLWPYFTDRSKLFVKHHFQHSELVDWEILAANIEYSRFPPLPDRNLETASYPGLLRAAHLIGTVADPEFNIKTKPLLVEMEESGMTGLLGYADIAAFRDGFKELFWTTIHPLVADGMKLLKLTGEGRELVANLHAHLLEERV